MADKIKVDFGFGEGLLKEYCQCTKGKSIVELRFSESMLKVYFRCMASKTKVCRDCRRFTEGILSVYKM